MLVETFDKQCLLNIIAKSTLTFIDLAIHHLKLFIIYYLMNKLEHFYYTYFSYHHHSHS